MSGAPVFNLSQGEGIYIYMEISDIVNMSHIHILNLAVDVMKLSQDSSHIRL